MSAAGILVELVTFIGDFLLKLVSIMTSILLQCFKIAFNMFVALFNTLLVSTFTFLQDLIRVVVWAVRLVLLMPVFSDQPSGVHVQDVLLTIFWAIMTLVYLRYALFPAVDWVLNVKPSSKWFSPKRRIGFRIVGTYITVVGLFTLFSFVRSFVDGFIG